MATGEHGVNRHRVWCHSLSCLLGGHWKIHTTRKRKRGTMLGAYIVQVCWDGPLLHCRLQRGHDDGAAHRMLWLIPYLPASSCFASPAASAQSLPIEKSISHNLTEALLSIPSSSLSCAVQPISSSDSFLSSSVSFPQSSPCSPYLHIVPVLWQQYQFYYHSLLSGSSSS